MTPQQRDAVYLEHILDCIKRINLYTEGDHEVFISSTLIQDGVIRNLQVLAESSQHLSDAAKATHPEIDWRAISGFRNILVHDYLGVDLQLIWDLLLNDLPLLRLAIEQLRASQPTR